MVGRHRLVEVTGVVARGDVGNYLLGGDLSVACLVMAFTEIAAVSCVISVISCCRKAVCRDP